MITHLLDSHKGWKEKIIKLKSPRGFGVSLEWRLVDDIQNRFLEVMKANAAIFFKLKKLSFPETLVKNEMVVGKHWP